MSPGHCFNSEGVGMKSEACHAAANDIMRKVKPTTYLGGMHGECVTRALYVGRPHH